MSYWDDNPDLLQLATMQPAVMPQQAGGSAPLPAAQAPQAGQFAKSQQGFLDWATQKYGADPTRGSGFVNAQAGGGLQNMLQQYGQATGNTATFQGGPSGDRVDFGQGIQDALTSGGQIWNPGAGGNSGGASSGGGLSYAGGSQNFNESTGQYEGGGGGNMAMPTAPISQSLTAPSPFSYQPSTLGAFQSPSPTPTMGQLSYTPMQAPASLDYTNLATPGGYTPDKATSLTAAEFAADPGVAVRYQRGLDAQQNTLAHAGALRTGAAAKALTDYGQQSASQEYGAADARKQAMLAQNNASSLGAYQTNAQTGLAYNQNQNANALNFGNANFNQAFQTNQANAAGQNAATQGNNQNALAAQGQQFTQAATGYGLNQGAQQQDYNQALGAYQANANTGLAYGSQNQNNALAQYQAQVNAALGQGNLNLGFQNSAQNYALGQGGLGIQQGQLGLQQQGQQFNQGLQTYQQNYQNQVLDPWNMNLQLANLGNPGAPNGQQYANQQSDLITGAGNAQAGSQIAQGNAQAGAWSNLGNLAAGAYGNSQIGGVKPPAYTPGIGQPLYY